MAQPWDRQKGETIKAFNQFVTYRDMGTGRTLAKVGAVMDLSPNWLTTLSKRYNWMERVLEYDSYIDALKRKDNEQEIISMNRRHSTYAQGMLSVLTQPMQIFLRRMKDEKGFMEQLEHMPARKLLTAVGRAAFYLNILMGAERRARGVNDTLKIDATGEVTHKHAGEVDVNVYGELGVPELRGLLKLAAYAQKEVADQAGHVQPASGENRAIQKDGQDSGLN